VLATPCQCLCLCGDDAVRDLFFDASASGDVRTVTQLVEAGQVKIDAVVVSVLFLLFTSIVYASRTNFD
jgi:hypothetical protein